MAFLVRSWSIKDIFLVDFNAIQSNLGRYWSYFDYFSPIECVLNITYTIFRKKKKSKDKKKDLEEAVTKSAEASSSSNLNSSESSEYFSKKTKAEIAFLKKKEERDVKRIREKASVSHKERVEKFNEYLNSLSEHYEPAKVSWTK